MWGGGDAAPPLPHTLKQLIRPMVVGHSKSQECRWYILVSQTPTYSWHGNHNHLISIHLGVIIEMNYNHIRLLKSQINICRHVSCKLCVCVGLYRCPIYYYPERAGSQGRESFVVAVDIKCGSEKANFWIKRATAMLLSLSN